MTSFGAWLLLDVDVWIALLVTGALAALCVAWSTWLFSTGRKIKP